MNYKLLVLIPILICSGCIVKPDIDSAAVETKSERLICAGVHTAEEQFNQAIRYKRSGQEKKMVACLKPAAESGHPLAQELLGTCYGMGKGGLPMTTVQAEFWYCKSLGNGNKNAARGLGRLMAGRLYSIERIELFKTPGYKHKLCDYETLERLKKNDPTKAIEKALDALYKKNTAASK